MIRSMTGYGKAAGEIAGKIISVEIKSLNSKFFELNLRMPTAYRDKEIELRSQLSKEADRGKMDITVMIEYSAGTTRSLLNKELIKVYIEDVKKLSDEMDLKATNLLDVVMHLPQVVNVDKIEADEEEWKLIKKLLDGAIKSFNEFRMREGKILQDDLVERVSAIENLLSGASEFENERMQNVRTKLQNALKGLDGGFEIDKNRFEQELIYYLEKLDITEEKVRLRAHCDYFKNVINQEDNCGKKLGFITQEIGREINTIGSKANDARLQRAVVEMKDEAEKIKEQLANVL